MKTPAAAKIPGGCAPRQLSDSVTIGKAETTFGPLPASLYSGSVIREGNIAVWKNRIYFGDGIEMAYAFTISQQRSVQNLS